MSNTAFEEDLAPIRIAGTVNDSITDGPGLRFTIFTQGCAHHCEGCHNPQAQPFEGGELKTVDELWQAVCRNPLLSGVTLSGGEPFEQAGALAPLALRIKEAGLELAAYSGYTWEELLAAGGDKVELLRLCDVLVDGRFVLALRNLDLRFRGSSNQRILDVRASLEQGCPVWMDDGRWNPKTGVL